MSTISLSLALTSIALLGALLVAFPGLWNQFIAGRSNNLRAAARRYGESRRWRTRNVPGRPLHFLRRWIKALALDQTGGYVHDTAMSQYIPPTVWHYVTGTFTQVAGAVAGTIAINRAAANETSVITIPITVPSNSVAQKGAYLKSVEVDYENFVGEATSLTWTLNKVTRGADAAAASVSAVSKTDTIAAADSHSVDQHKQVITLNTPAWVDNDEYYLLELALVSGASGCTQKFYGAVANFTLRM